MNIAEAKQQVKDTVEAYLSKDETGAYLIPDIAQRPVFLVGAPGIGKTAIVGQVAKELEIGVVSYSMTHHTRQSALGLPLIVHKSYGDAEFDVSEYTMSEIIASIYDYIEETGRNRGILFLDEINCVSETLYPTMLQFLQFKAFGRHKVPSGWVIVCAGNPPEYNRNVREFDVVTLDRMRKIVIDPDLDAWLDYAHATGAHPAITSYLEIRRDCFYAVESTASEKSFVTARSWDDLSKVMSIYEVQGREVGLALIGQYVQDERIADHFAQYYMLFSKYRTDYRVLDILKGVVAPEVAQRAKEARFDERLALLGLMLEALDGKCADVLEDEQCVAAMRDALREIKATMAEDAHAAIQPLLEAGAVALHEEASRRVNLEMQSDVQVRPLRLAARRLVEFVAECEKAKAYSGAPAFECASRIYEGDVSKLRDDVRECSGAIDNAFEFVEQTFGDGRELAVFVAELTGHSGTSRFVSTFGNEAYYAHNASVQVRSNRDALLERVAELDLGE